MMVGWGNKAVLLSAFICSSIRVPPRFLRFYLCSCADYLCHLQFYGCPSVFIGGQLPKHPDVDPEPRLTGSVVPPLPRRQIQLDRFQITELQLRE